MNGHATDQKNMPLTNNIRQHREKQNITQEQLAEAAGVSRQTIIAIEKGTYEPSLGLAMRLAKYFKLKVEEIFMLKWSYVSTNDESTNDYK